MNYFVLPKTSQFMIYRSEVLQHPITATKNHQHYFS
jgi:hypothetical protein